MSNVISLVEAGDPVDLLCIEIGEDAISSCDGDVREAMRSYRGHSAEIILAVMLDAVRRGENHRALERQITTLAVALEEAASH